MEPKEILATLRLVISGTVSNAKLGRFLAARNLRALELPSLAPEAFEGMGLTMADIADVQAIASGQCKQQVADSAASVLEAALGSGCKLIGLQDPAYPLLLKQIHDPPAVLFVNGNPGLLNEFCIAVVGSRHASAQANRFTRWLAAELAGSGLTIVSGLARGIDSSAHRGALESGNTIAVIGTGTDVYYPKSNRGLQVQLENEGAVVSEFLPGAPPRAAQFPQRNRIISGISLGTIVIEATLRSGSLITARFAAEQGREVFAVPGQVDREQTKGCHRLLREGAVLVESAADVLAELPIQGLMQYMAIRKPDPVSTGVNVPSNLERSILRRIAAFENLPRDLMKSERLTPAELNNVLLKLELAGMIENRNGRVHLRD